MAGGTRHSLVWSPWAESNGSTPPHLHAKSPAASLGLLGSWGASLAGTARGPAAGAGAGAGAGREEARRGAEGGAEKGPFQSLWEIAAGGGR